MENSEKTAYQLYCERLTQTIVDSLSGTDYVEEVDVDIKDHEILNQVLTGAYYEPLGEISDINDDYSYDNCTFTLREAVKSAIRDEDDEALEDLLAEEGKALEDLQDELIDSCRQECWDRGIVLHDVEGVYKGEATVVHDLGLVVGSAEMYFVDIHGTKVTLDVPVLDRDLVWALAEFHVTIDSYQAKLREYLEENQVSPAVMDQFLLDERAQMKEIQQDIEVDETLFEAPKIDVEDFIRSIQRGALTNVRIVIEIDADDIDGTFGILAWGSRFPEKEYLVLEGGLEGSTVLVRDFKVKANGTLSPDSYAWHEHGGGSLTLPWFKQAQAYKSMATAKDGAEAFGILKRAVEAELFDIDWLHMLKKMADANDEAWKPVADLLAEEVRAADVQLPLPMGFDRTMTLDLIRMADLPGDGEVGEQRIAWLISQGADINGVDAYGNTVLHHAVRAGNAAMVRHLLQLGVAHSLRNAKGDTPAMQSVENHDILLDLAKAGADLGVEGDNFVNRAYSSRRDITLVEPVLASPDPDALLAQRCSYSWDLALDVAKPTALAVTASHLNPEQLSSLLSAVSQDTLRTSHADVKAYIDNCRNGLGNGRYVSPGRLEKLERNSELMTEKLLELTAQNVGIPVVQRNKARF